MSLGREGTNDVGSKPQKSEDAEHEENIFFRAFIPRTLNEVYDPERDVEKVRRGDADGLIYADTIGLVTQSRLDEDGSADLKQTAKKKHSYRSTTLEVKEEEEIEVDQVDRTGDETESSSTEDEEEEEEGKLKENFEERKPNRESKRLSQKIIFPFDFVFILY